MKIAIDIFMVFSPQWNGFFSRDATREAGFVKLCFVMKGRYKRSAGYLSAVVYTFAADTGLEYNLENRGILYGKKEKHYATHPHPTFTLYHVCSGRSHGLFQE